MSNPRGDSQARILLYIQKATKEKGYPPSVREICDATGLKSTSTVHGHLLRLQKKGLLNRDSMKPRAISIPAQDTSDTDAIPVPIVGCVTAGLPILATENVDEYIPLPPAMLGEGEHYILKVRGESMIDAGIMDGDMAVIEQSNTVRNGGIAVVMMDDAVTLKTFYRENARIRLQPENPKYSPIYCSRDVRILGKLAHIFRSYG